MDLVGRESFDNLFPVVVRSFHRETRPCRLDNLPQNNQRRKPMSTHEVSRLELSWFSTILIVAHFPLFLLAVLTAIESLLAPRTEF